MAAPPDPAQVGPGFLGFVVLFLLALVCVLLFRSMVAHVRRVNYGPGPDGDDARHPEPGPPEEGPDR